MERVCVLGSGLMGHSIALNVAWQGMNVMLQGLDKDEIARAEANIAMKLDTMRRSGLIDNSEMEIAAGRIKYTVSVEEAVSDRTFVIEAIPEDLKLKQEFHKKLDSLCHEDVVLASNTSGLDPTAIAEGMIHPERMLIVHFWNPAHLIPLVEVVGGDKTETNVITRAMELLRRMDKKPIQVKKSIPGFVGNRLQYALFREAQYILESGVASMEDIETAATYSIGRRLPITGPFMSADLGGLDVFHAISEYLFSDLANSSRSLAKMRSLVEQGHLGLKSGKGFYNWDEASALDIARQREELLIHFLKVEK